MSFVGGGYRRNVLRGKWLQEVCGEMSLVNFVGGGYRRNVFWKIVAGFFVSGLREHVFGESFLVVVTAEMFCRGKWLQEVCAGFAGKCFDEFLLEVVTAEMFLEKLLREIFVGGFGNTVLRGRFCKTCFPQNCFAPRGLR